MSQAMKRRLQKQYGISSSQADELFRMLEEERQKWIEEDNEKRAKMKPVDIAQQQIENQMLREQTRLPYIEQMEQDLAKPPLVSYDPMEQAKSQGFDPTQEGFLDFMKREVPAQLNSMADIASFGLVSSDDLPKDRLLGQLLGYGVGFGGVGLGLRALKGASNPIAKGLSKITADTKGKSLGGRALQRAKEGAGIEALWTGADIGIREGISDPDQYTAMENLQRFGLNVGLGAVADPLVGAGLDLLRGARRAGTPPTQQQQEILGLPAPQQQLPAPQQQIQGIPARRAKGELPYQQALQEFTNIFNRIKKDGVPYRTETLDRLWKEFQTMKYPNLNVSLDDAIRFANGRISQSQLNRLRTRIASGQPLDFQPQTINIPDSPNMNIPDSPNMNVQRQSQTIDIPDNSMSSPNMNVQRQLDTTVNNTPNQPVNPAQQVKMKAQSLINKSEIPVSETMIDQLNNPLRRAINKMTESYLNANRQFTLAEQNVLDQNIKRIQERLKSPDLPANEKQQLTQQLEQFRQQRKYLNRHESSVEKAVQNEQTWINRSRTFINRHFSQMEQVLGKDVKMHQALEYQMARNLLWNLERGRIDMDTYKLPKGITWDRVRQIVQEGSQNPRLQQFSALFRQMNEELLEHMRRYDLISQEDFRALVENPEYIPLYRDARWRTDNVSLSSVYQQNAKRSSDPKNLYRFEEGSATDYFKNPLESMVESIMNVHRMALRNDTAQQLYRLAEIDPSGQVVKRISRQEYEQSGGLEVHINGETEYIRPQGDLLKILQENEQHSANVVSRMTSLVAGLKTRSFEYQFATSALRDAPLSVINSHAQSIGEYFTALRGVLRDRRLRKGTNQQINELLERWHDPNLSPAEHNQLKNELKQLMSQTRNVSDLGIFFRDAYKSSNYGVDPDRVRMEMVKDLDGISQERAGEKVKKIFKKLDDTIFFSKKFGNLIDALPREIEAKIVQNRYADKVKPLQRQVDNIEKQLQNPNLDAPQRSALEIELQRANDELDNMIREMEREQTYRGLDIINYSKTGRSGLSKGLRKYVMFANTATQSKARLAKSFRQRPVQTALRASTLVGFPITVHNLWHLTASDAEREAYANIPQYMKDFNYIFVLNDGKDVVTLPKIQEFAPFMNLFEAYYTGEDMIENAELLLRELLPAQVGQMFGQSIVNVLDEDSEEGFREGFRLPSNVVTPALEALVNDKLGFNRKPVSYAPNVADPYTSDLFKGIFGEESDSADIAEYLTRQYGGDLAKYGIAGLEYLTQPNDDTLQNMIQQINPLQDRYYATEDSDTFMSNFFKEPYFTTERKGRHESLGNEVTQRFHQELSQLRSERNQARAESREIIRSRYPMMNENEVSRLVDTMTTYEREAEYQQFLQLAKQLDPIIYQMESVQGSTDLSEEEKELRLRQLRQQEEAITRSIRRMLGW